MTEQAESKQLTIFIIGAGQGVGLAAATLATRAGHKVVGTTELGSVGAYRIRRAGGIPIYPDLTRESAVYSALQMGKADVIINAAPQALNGLPQYNADYETLLPWLTESTDAIMAAAGRADIDRIIHISSASIYGDTHHEAVTEDAHLDLSTPLAKALHQAEEAVLDGGIPGYVLRAGYILGTHQSYAAVAEQLRAGKSLPNGNKPTAWAYDEDVARAALTIAEKTSDDNVAHVYNIASDETASPDDLLDKFGAAYGTGRPLPLSGFMAQFRVNDVQRALLNAGTLLDTTKARTELDWSPKGSIDLALDKMLLLWHAEDAEVTVYHQEENSDSTEIVKA